MGRNVRSMSFVSRLTRCPDAHNPDRGADALQAVPDIDPGLQPLIHGTAGSSPYLAGLIASEAAWLPGALDDPEATTGTLIADLSELAPDAVSVGLRGAKRRVALLTALADLGGVWPLETVTDTLTSFADAAVAAAMRATVGAEIARGKLPGDPDIDCAGGMVALAMGKMGAGELNYSSDIDLIWLFDETKFEPDDYHDARAAFVRATRRMTAILSDVSAGGYVFRTDLRLRPDASVTPVCLSMEAAEQYYESVGRTWERAAYIKARPCAGDLKAGESFLDALRPFVWRKHLDFAAIQDAHDMRLRIRDHKQLHGRVTLEGHNMKLGRGGIREIEFFTQTRQLIAGGRDLSLRVRRTDEGLDRLAAAGWISRDVADGLLDHYRFHREVEHRLQMINDAQTHELPGDAEGFDRLAALMGRDVAGLRSELLARLDEVHKLTEGFFAPSSPKLQAVEWGDEVTARWPSYPALRSARATEIFKRITPEIMARLQDAARPDEALAQFDAFLAGLPAGVQLFSLFEANPQLTQLIVDIAATAPALAQYLSANAGVLDAVIAGPFFDDWPGRNGLRLRLDRALELAPDYEGCLLAARRWTKEWHFRVGVHYLRGLINADEAGRQYADLAEVVVAGLWPRIVHDFATRHGSPPGRGAVVLGMGSLGAGRLHAKSDLDLIMIYDGGKVDMSDGRRPLATKTYYARLTQALITALAAPMAEGRLYEADMRLRPSGRQGPVATSLDAFYDYQRNQAWTWEHLALTRARVIAGPADLGTEIEAFRCDLIKEKGQGPTVAADVADMRRRIADVKSTAGDFDMKIGPGRLQDIELFGQALALQRGTEMLETRRQIDMGQLPPQSATILRDAVDLYWKVHFATYLLAGETLDPDAVGVGGRRVILRETGFETMDELLENIEKIAGQASGIIETYLSEGMQSEG